MPIDWGSTGIHIATILLEQIEQFTQGAPEDLKAYSNEIATDLMIAMETADYGLIGELQAQLKVIAEVYNIQLNNQAWDNLKRTVLLVFRVGLTIAAAAV